jgi:RNA polymerase sigma factor (sigma-70 family)
VTTEEYNDCVLTHSDGVFRFILKNLANRADAEDVVQNAFEKLWVNREQVLAEKAKSYLYTVAYNAMIDQIRKRKFIDHSETAPETGSDRHERQMEARELIDKTLSSLTPTHKSLLLLRDYEGYSYEEIAQITELSLSQVKVYLFRARKQFQETLTALEQSALPKIYKA